VEQSHEERWRRSVTYREDWYKERVSELESVLRKILEDDDVAFGPYARKLRREADAVLSKAVRRG
jgi:hypothetical protein